jgi:ferredoxin-NADP reductase
MVTVPERHRYHALSVRRVQRETADAASIVFDVPDELAPAFSYRPGQFVTLKVNIAGEPQFRSYSMSSAPELDEHLQVTVKRVAGGLVSNWLNDNVTTGCVLDVSPPGGSFVLGDGRHDVVGFGAGSGITPLFSIVKSGLARGGRRFRLLYANRDRAAAIFADELDALADAHPEHFALTHHFDIDRGFVDCATVAAYVGTDSDVEVFICGPPPFMDRAQAAIASRAVPAERVHIERFTPAEEPPAGDVDEMKITITVGGRTATVPHRANTTILHAARSAGLRAPSSCETGACATCMARVVEGAAHMRHNEALTADEVADGWILTCQAVPVTPVVTVVYE